MKLHERPTPPGTPAAPPLLAPITTGSLRHPGDVAAAVVLFLVAAYFRLAELNFVQYREDDDALWNIVTSMARTGVVPHIGMLSSIGLPNGPFQALLLAPLGWIGADPPLMTAAVGLLNVLAVALTYGFARDFFGRRVGLLALLLVAANPWAVVLSRRLWGDDMVAPFAVLSLWMLASWLWRGDRRAIVVAAVALAIVAQVYIVGLECLVTAAAAALLAGRRMWTRWTGLAAVVFCALVARYGFYAVVPNLHALLAIGRHADSTTMTDLRAAQLAIELASNEGYQAFALQGGSHLDATSGIPGALGVFARLLYVLGLVIGAVTVIRGPGRLRDEQRGIHVLLIISVIVPIVVLLHHAVAIYPYYLLSAFPAPYVYGAVAVERIWQWSGRRAQPPERAARALLTVGVAALFAVQCALGAVFLSVIHEYWVDGNYGMPWQTIEHLVQESRQLEGQYRAARVLVPEHAEDANVLYRVLAQNGADDAEFDDRRMLVISGAPAVYLVVGNEPAESILAGSYQQDLVRQERLPGDGTIVRYYVLPGSSPGSLPPTATQTGWTAGGLIRLDGAAVPRRIVPGSSIVATSYATVFTRPDATVPDFSLFVHLVQADGSTLAGHDDATWPTRFWRPGDRIEQWLSLSIPAVAQPGVISLSTGVYSTGTPDHPGLIPLTLIDSHGVKLGPVGTLPVAAISPPRPATPQHGMAIRYAEGIDLDGFDLAQTGNTLTATLHWHATASVSRDYTAFVHVLDSSGKIVAQNDAQPVQGQFPTSIWLSGDVIADAHRVDMPPGLSPGTYRLEFGLYDLHTLQRLAIVSGQTTTPVTLPLGH